MVEMISKLDTIVSSCSSYETLPGLSKTLKVRTLMTMVLMKAAASRLASAEINLFFGLMQDNSSSSGVRMGSLQQKLPCLQRWYNI